MNYSDIVKLPRHEPATQPRMSMENRAAQFAPFAALNGYEDEVSETARLVSGRIELSEDENSELERKTRLIMDEPGREALITYFVPDRRKSGGAYITKKCVLRDIDLVERAMVLSDRTRIPLDDIIDVCPV